MEDVAGRGDWITGVEQRAIGQLGCCGESKCQRLVAGDLAVFARRQLGRWNSKLDSEGFGREPVILATLQSLEVRLGDFGLLGEFFGDPVACRSGVAFVQPVDQSEREEVLAAIRFARGKTEVLLSLKAWWRPIGKISVQALVQERAQELRQELRQHSRPISNR